MFIIKRIKNEVNTYGIIEAILIVKSYIFWKIFNYLKLLIIGVKLGKGIIFEGIVRVSGGKRVTIGDNAKIGRGVVLDAGKNGKIEIGCNTYVGMNTIIIANSEVKIGSNCLISPFCYIIDTNHGTALGESICNQSYISLPVIIGDDVWLGTHCVILKGVKLGDGVVIGAGGIANKSISENMVAVGVPARPIKTRK